MIILLTGATGFLGSSLKEYWRKQGYTVRDIGPLRLGQPMPPHLLESCHLLVHAAHDFSLDAFHRNHQGAISWFDAARAAGVPHQIFLSSFSARPDTPSIYGKTKYSIEQHFLQHGATIVRPGLVTGPGGLYARLVERLPSLAPLVEPDVRSVAIITLEDFLAAMTALVNNPQPGAWNLFAPHLLTTREFTHHIWRTQNKRGIIVPIPSALAIAVLRATRNATLLDSLQGQLANRVPIHTSDLHKLIPL
ncbi:MAG: hypothetical protein JST93_09715 [Acidobacteria bacterium]|nr:hypothetical protein [Acidobacteriota bacterium]